MPDDAKIERPTGFGPTPASLDVEAKYPTTTDLIAAAQKKMPPPVWDYISGGVETETTLRRNRMALESLAFLPRVLRNVTGTDLTRDFLGQTHRIPLFLAPMGGLQQINPAGALPAAKAAGDFGIPYMMSTVTMPDMEVVAEAANGRFYFQLYVQGDEAWVDEIARRAKACGCKGFAVTVDSAHYSRRERAIMNGFQAIGRNNNGARMGDSRRQELDWDWVDRLKDKHDMPMMMKGIQCHEDAALCVEHGVEVVYVSNHGGRQMDHAVGTTEILPEIVEAVGGKAKIVIDGGFGRGSDILKAIALGADMVAMGRLQAWALAADGEAGVRRLLDLLELELTIDMKLLGVNRYEELSPKSLRQVLPTIDPSVFAAFPMMKYWQPKSKDELT